MAVAGSDVRQTPDCLELKLGALDVLAKLEEARDQVAIDCLLNGRLNFERQKLADARHGQDLDHLHVTRKIAHDLVKVRLLQSQSILPC